MMALDPAATCAAYRDYLLREYPGIDWRVISYGSGWVRILPGDRRVRAPEVRRFLRGGGDDGRTNLR